MLKPSMQELMKKVGNRYLLVNLAAQRARDIADEEENRIEDSEGPVEYSAEKPVQVALEEIAAGEIVYRPGKRTEPVIVQNNPVAAAHIDIDHLEFEDEGDQSIDMDEDDVKLSDEE